MSLRFTTHHLLLLFLALNATAAIKPRDPITITPHSVITGDTSVAGSSWWDLQANGSVGRMLEIDETTGYVYLVWNRGNDSLAVSRQAAYNVFRTASRSWLYQQNGMRVTPPSVPRSGYPTMGLFGGQMVVALHDTGHRNGIMPITEVYIDSIVGEETSLFSSDPPFVYVDTTVTSAIWPKIAVGRNGALHVVMTERTDIRNMRQWYLRGIYQPQTQAVAWGEAIQLPGTVFQNSIVVAASRVSNKAAVAWMHPMSPVMNPPELSYTFSNNVVFVESPDGSTWNFNNFHYMTNWRNPNEAFMPDTTLANQDTFRANNSIDLVYSPDDVLYAAFTTGLFFRWDNHWTTPYDSSFYYYGQCWFWRSDEPNWIRMAVNGGNIGSAISVNPGDYNRTVSRPSLSVANNGDIYMTYMGHFDWNDTTMAQDVSYAGECNFDIFVTKSTDGGHHWAQPTNITHTRSPGARARACYSETCPTTNQSIYNNQLHVQYLLDKDAGSVLSMEGYWTNNPIIYHRVPVNRIRATPLDQHLRAIWFQTNEPMVVTEHPTSFVLEGNYPNPFNSSTDIVFSLNFQMEVKLAVYDIQGRQVAELSKGRLNAGKYKVTFDGRDLSSGVYFARLTANGVTSTRKMTLLK